MATAAATTRGSERLMTAAGLVTWLVVGAPVLAAAVRWSALQEPGRVAGFLVAWAAFGVSLVWRSASGRGTLIHLAVQTATALIANWLIPLPIPGVAITGALLVTVAAGLAPVVGGRAARAWIIAQSLALLAIYVHAWSLWAPALIGSGAYLGFQLFALFTAEMAQRESRARAALAEATVALLAARADEERHARTAERERIWRELHDVLGHHLAALSLTLEAAARMADGRSGDAVRRAQALARLLLADIRSVMSEADDGGVTDLRTALPAMARDLPGLQVEVSVAEDAAPASAATAHALLRCAQEALTNTLKHSGASRSWIDLSRRNGSLVLRAGDNGRGAGPVERGRGLRGMQERITGLGGTLELGARAGHGFELTATIPDPPPAAEPIP